MPSAEILKYFPHDTIRAGQEDLVEDLAEALANKKTLLAHAPTGLGKTASALCVALAEAIKHKKKIFFLTNRHTQHQIAVNTLKLVKEKIGQEIVCADLIGKRWMCNQEIAGLFGNEFNEYCKSVVEKGECAFYSKVRDKKGLTVEGKALVKQLQGRRPLHNEELIGLSKEKEMCSYEVSLALAKEATIIIGDYYYIFNPFIQSTLFNKLDLQMADVILIVDEGHNLPSRVTDMLSNNLTTNMLSNAILEAKKFSYKGIIGWLSELNHILTGLADFETNSFVKEKLVEKSDFELKVKKAADYKELINELELAADEIRKKQRRSYLGGIASFLEEWLGDDEGFVRMISEKQGTHKPVISLKYACLDPSIVTKAVFQNVHSAVIMSGTLKPTFMYKDLLGIGESMEKEYSSPFPPENKLSLIVPDTSTKYNLRGEAMYKRIAQACSDFSFLIPGNVALFFPSYDLRDRVGIFFNSEKHLFWEKRSMTKEEKEEFLEEFKAKKDSGGVLLGVTGANFAEGVDFPGDLLNGAVIIGLPLARPDLITNKTISYYDLKFGKGWDYGYTYPAINKCLQSAGRCIRSESDRGVVIYLDERFAWQNYFSCFPREGLIVSKDYKKLLNKFFNN